MSPTDSIAQLRAELEYSWSIIDTSPAFFATIGSDGKTRVMNQTMLTALGYTQDEVIGTDYMSTFVPERDREMLGEVFARLAQDTRPTLNENRVLAKDGRELLVEWHGRSFFDEAGVFQYFTGVGIEVGERRRMEDALRRSDQKVALHFQQTPLGVIEWDVDFKATEWNPAAERIFGFSRAEALGRHPVGLIIAERFAAIVGKVWGQLLSQRATMRTRYSNVTKDGRLIVCDWYNTALIGADGQVMGVASLVDDVTEQAAQKEELQRREQAQIETIQRLSTPVLEVWEGILTLPIIGAVDDARAARMTEALLEHITRTRAAFAIVDLTGMDGVDAANAEHLLRMVRAAQLLGSRCLISGISPATARTMIELGIGVVGLTTFSSLRSALSYALESARSKRA